MTVKAFRAVPKISPGARDLACRGITFVSLELAPRILIDPDIHISLTHNVLFLFLTSQAHVYEEVINWLQYDFKGDRMGDYVDLESTFLTWIRLVEGEPLFTPYLCALQQSFSGNTPHPQLRLHLDPPGLITSEYNSMSQLVGCTSTGRTTQGWHILITLLVGCPIIGMQIISNLAFIYPPV